MSQRSISYILFLSSYIPLFLILFLQNLDDKYVSICLVILIVVSFIGLIGFCFTYENKGRNKEIVVNKVENKGIDNLNYMSGYVIPFISLNMPIIVENKLDIANIISIVIILFLLLILFLNKFTIMLMIIVIKINKFIILLWRYVFFIIEFVKKNL